MHKKDNNPQLASPRVIATLPNVLAITVFVLGFLIEGEGLKVSTGIL